MPHKFQNVLSVFYVTGWALHYIAHDMAKIDSNGKKFAMLIYHAQGKTSKDLLMNKHQ